MNPLTPEWLVDCKTIGSSYNPDRPGWFSRKSELKEYLMVEIRIEGANAVFEVEGWDKLWSLRSRLEIPVTHIRGAHADPSPAMGWFQGLRLAGTDVPNFFRAGTFYQEGSLVFWDVCDPDRTVVIELEHERYRKLIIEVADPGAAVKLIETAVAANRG
jgi:hypothetical protein